MKIYFLTLIALAVLLGAVSAFQSDESTSESAMDYSNSSYVSEPSYRNVQLYIRKVDEVHPYFMSFSFRVPLELNYALPAGQLYNRFTEQISRHCNAGNITRVVLNNFAVISTDVDVWRLKNNGRIEMWSADSGMPTRAQTVSAYAKGALRKDLKSIGGGRRGMRMGGRRAGRGGRGGRPGRRMQKQIDDEVIEGAIVVPDFDGDGEMDLD